MLKKTLFLVAGSMLAAVPVLAGNGHLLHGVGAINSSLGGSGAGMPFDVLGALHTNPALLTQLDDMHVAMSVEVFVDDLKATTEASPSAALPQGAPRHKTESDGEPGILPALGWSLHKPDSKWAYGFGVLAVAGFRTNYPVDAQSLLLAPQPNGFGRLSTELQVTKIPFALAYQVNPDLSIGGSFNFYVSRLIINPLPVVVPDCTGTLPNGDLDPTTCYRPNTGVMVTEFATSVQLGLYYEMTDAWSLGFSYTSNINTGEYEWNSAHANPDITSGPNAFGNPRRIGIDLDQPANAVLGFGYRPNDKLKVAFDVRWVGYSTEKGIGGQGGINGQQQLVSIGWRDIWIAMLGVEYQASEDWTLRAGLNFNQSPIRESLTLNSGGTPSVFEEHYTVGVSRKITDHFKIDLGAYYTPANEIEGPFIGVPNATVAFENSILSALAGFSFSF
ncbi:MAG: hypothetical protein HC897_01815 [Thermoanaerobaculia bacterium]|nr:hypothetical protein [Thermoanaerobaculia bacterium]